MDKVHRIPFPLLLSETRATNTQRRGSIESNTLVIASCIPIMQPLLDLCVNKRTRTPTPLARASPYSHRHYDNEMAPAPGSHYHRRLRSSSDVSFHSLEVGKGVARRDLDSSPVERDKNPRPESMAGVRARRVAQA